MNADALVASLTLLNTLIASAQRVSARIAAGQPLNRDEVLAQREQAKAALDAAIEAAEQRQNVGQEPAQP